MATAKNASKTATKTVAGKSAKAGKTSMSMMAHALSPVAGEKAKSKPPAKAAPAAEPKAPKAEKDTGPKKIVNCGDLLKALWSSRGNVYAPIVGFGSPLAIVKSSLTGHLKDGDLAAPAMFDLVQRADNSGADLVPMKK